MYSPEYSSVLCLIDACLKSWSLLDFLFSIQYRQYLLLNDNVTKRSNNFANCLLSEIKCLPQYLDLEISVFCSSYQLLAFVFWIGR